VAYKYIHPALHSGFCGKEIQEYGLADEHSTHRPGPQPAPSASVPAPVVCIGKRNKEEGFAQSLGCRPGWYRAGL